jgi:hypothetical protein
MCDRESEIIIQHLNPLSATGLTLKDWPEANWQSLIFGKRDKCFHTSQTAKKKNHVLLSFPSSTRARSLFRSNRACGEVLEFLSLAEKWGSLEGVRDRGFTRVSCILAPHPSHLWQASTSRTAPRPCGSIGGKPGVGYRDPKP